ncbi:hypothetical protein [Marinobacter halophilus]|uniref:Uncharacterized protein n=1 Tax=Marinobacter halophilus TaxID=1323740 RepID=A0A2T1K926_9GAMM|nr:hypothetical protein [Marinobacter halophilus]PSF06518.1 hypothetical protein C7H08_15565 [Marinobacter halophilus]GGC73310.1 hypothetical protein GCM10011362_22280 [Marinobacter halophilus]
MTELEKLKAEIGQLSPMSDEAIQELVDNGEDAERLIEKEEQNAARRRVLQFKANALEKKLAEENRKAAGKELKAIDAKLDATTDEARAAMADAWQAVKAFQGAMQRFQTLGDTYTAHANEAALMGQQAGIARGDSPRGLFASVNSMERSIVESLEAYRRPKPFNHLMIESEE